jgi:LPS-assembly lipoprotein
MLILSALALGGCGFTPLYGSPGVSPKLSSIEVARPDGRTGYLMGQFLDDDFAKDRAVAPAYRLTFKTRETRIPRGIRVNNVASRYELQLAATYTLTDIKTRAAVTQGQVEVNVSYDSADQPYAGIAAESEGQQRAAEQAAQRIRLELATYFASPAPAAKPATAAAAPDTGAVTYSERLQPANILSPRERALGQAAPQGATSSSMFGSPLQNATPNDPQLPTAPSDAAPPAPAQ